MQKIWLPLVIGVLLLLPALNSASANHEIGDEVIHTNIYELVVKTSPPGLYIDGSGMYQGDTWVKTGAAPEGWGAFEFVGWKVDDRWYSGNPLKILMDREHTAIAIYSANHVKKQGSDDGKNNLLTIISSYGKTTGSGSYLVGETAEFRVLEQYVYDEFQEGIRYAFAGWDTGNTPNLMSNSIIMDESKVVKANWNEQYRLDHLNSMSEMDLIGAGWYDNSSRASLVAINDSEPGSGAGIKYVFKEWVNVGPNAALIEDPKSSATSIIMEKSYAIMADWKKQYYLDISSEYGKVEGAGYYDAGTYATASIDSEVGDIGKAGIRVIFDGWDGDANSDGMNVKVFMDGPKSLDAKWEKQYYLTINSEYGNPSGSDWYDQGQVATFGISIPRDPAGFWKQQIFYGWDGSFTTTSMTGAVLMNGPKIVNAQWSEDYSTAYLNIVIIVVTGVGSFFAYKKMRKRKATPPPKEDKPISHYINRYHSNAEFRHWFDETHPGMTIQEALGKKEHVS